MLLSIFRPFIPGLVSYYLEFRTLPFLDPLLSSSGHPPSSLSAAGGGVWWFGRVARQLNTVLTAPVDGDCVTYFLKGQVRD